MKLIIEISDNHFKTLQKMNECGLGYYQRAILNGTPLPKGHGDLIDRNECLKMKMTDLYDKDGITMYAVPTGNILRMKPVIEADKGE